jgi:hypothetical protein
MRNFTHSTAFLILLAAGVCSFVSRVSAQESGSNLPSFVNLALVDDPKSSVAEPVRNSDEAEQKRQAVASAGEASGNISGTVRDTNGNIVPDATVQLEGPQTVDSQTALTNGEGSFQFSGLKANTPYRIQIRAKNLEGWKSQAITLDPGQYYFLPGVALKVPDVITSVTVYADQVQIATEQVDVQEKQRVFGIIPNFYVSYDPNAVALTTGLKFKLAMKADTDIMTFVGVAFMSALYQAGDIPDYGQGMQGYAKRMAAGYADTTSDIFIGGAILPWMLHQDPRYFYQGTGTTKSRMYHALFSPFVCRGDNGKNQPNFSSVGGDLASGAISNLYYPESNRGAGLVFQGFFITTGVRMVNAVLQEFVLRKLTPSARAKY